MENQKQKKIKFTTFVILLVIFIIIIGGIYFYTIKNIPKDNQNLISDDKITNNKVETESQIKEQIYSIKNKDFYLYGDAEGIDEEYRGVKLLEYDNLTNDYAEIYYISYDYSTDPSFYYTLEITDESNNTLLLDGKKEEQVIGGVVSKAKIKSLSLDNKINFSIFEKYIETNEIVNSSKIQIDLEKDLENKEKIDQISNLKEGKLGDVKFKYIDSEYVYFGTTSHSYSQKLVGENFSIPVKVQYGNRLISEEYIEFSYDKNVNNLKLEEAFESLALINKTVGQYGLSDVYGMTITDEQENIIDTVIISFDEMMKLCKGLTIEKNGTEYTKQSFETFSNISMIKDKNVEIGNGIQAIKYYFETEDNYEQYMFIYKDNIYNVKVPINNRIDSEVKQFLNSLELI